MPKKSTIKATSSSIKIFILVIAIFSIIPKGSAADITIETYVQGGVSITKSGEWNNDLTMSQAYLSVLSTENQTTHWSRDTDDYISFADDTTTDGFYITIDFTDFIYSGASQSQTDIPATNYEIIANYDSDTAQAPSMGEDDPTKTLSILPDSCQSTGTEDFTFHADFSSSGEGYALTGSTSEQTILTGTNTCLALGHIRFDRTELTVPQYSEEGTYTSTITLTIYDGAP